ncbi:unnamed protein product [Prunus armeniaca]|nr:unnamed protein product [Prunus armeniaca]
MRKKRRKIGRRRKKKKKKKRFLFCISQLLCQGLFEWVALGLVSLLPLCSRSAYSHSFFGSNLFLCYST